MLGHGATGQFAIGQVPGGDAAETITPDKWFMPLSEPVRQLPGVKTAAQPFFAFNPQPFVPFAWFEALSEPARQLPRSPATLAPFQSWQPAPSPFVATGWFMPLSEPVRKRPGLLAGEQQFFAADTTVIPTSKLIEWFMPLSEPVRFLPGLSARLQQFFAMPPQLRPNPATSGVLSALETKDVFLSGAAFFNRPTSGEVGIIEQSFTGAEIGVIEQALSAGTSGVIEQGVVPTPGSAAPVITVAHVSIRIV